MGSTGGGRITQNVEIMAIQQYSRMVISNFGTKQVLNPRASESVPFWFWNRDICDTSVDTNPIILGYILGSLDTFPAFFVALELKWIKSSTINSFSQPWSRIISHSCRGYILFTLWDNTMFDFTPRMLFVPYKKFFLIFHKCIFWTWPPFSSHRFNYYYYYYY